ncbi:uncharacterized protein LOC101925031 isoform X1 [Falco peregrinus]|uniref:uncharacterized protein LOC101925031 isoform X1 n=1 Tax=Falco peregrinus TaxID=8954 RepID=UPI00247B2402|nr:uncharacterized protein LOC101925031 isoform X1 [Falco peregrinus]
MDTPRKGRAQGKLRPRSVAAATAHAIGPPLPPPLFPRVVPPLLQRHRGVALRLGAAPRHFRRGRHGGGGRCGREACGALCPLLSYFGAGYADYAVLAHVLPQTALRGRCRRAPEERAGGDPRGLPGVWKVLGRGRVLVLVGPPWCRPDPRPHLPASWCPFHAAAFNLIVLLLLACRARRPRRPWCGSPPQHHRRLLCPAQWGESLSKARQSLRHRAGAGCLAGTGRQESSRDGGRRRHGKQPRPNVMLIIMDETPLEQICNQGLKETNQEELCPPKPKLVLLQEVFGQGAWGWEGLSGQVSQHGSCFSPSLRPGFVLCWLFPWSRSPPLGTDLGYSPLPIPYSDLPAPSTWEDAGNMLTVASHRDPEP